MKPHNNGFVGEKPIHFDVEKLAKNEEMKRPEVFKEDLDKIAEKTERWIKQNYPEHQSEIHQYLEEKLSLVNGKSL